MSHYSRTCGASHLTAASASRSCASRRGALTRFTCRWVVGFMQYNIQWHHSLLSIQLYRVYRVAHVERHTWRLPLQSAGAHHNEAGASEQRLTCTKHQLKYDTSTVECCWQTVGGDEPCRTCGASPVMEAVHSRGAHPDKADASNQRALIGERYAKGNHRYPHHFVA